MPDVKRVVLPIRDLTLPGLTTYYNDLIKREDRLHLAMALQ
jgi:hypothetical protein